MKIEGYCVGCKKVKVVMNEENVRELLKEDGIFGLVCDKCLKDIEKMMEEYRRSECPECGKVLCECVRGWEE
jgi:hypothetical protein